MKDESMKENEGLAMERFARTAALAGQAMAVWHLALAVGAFVFVMVALLAGMPGGALSEDAAIKGAELVGSGGAAALVLGGASWWVLRREFWRPRWSVILVPGLIGTFVAQFFDVIGWPVAVLVGGWAAYWIIDNGRAEIPDSGLKTSA